MIRGKDHRGSALLALLALTLAGCSGSGSDAAPHNSTQGSEGLSGIPVAATPAASTSGAWSAPEIADKAHTGRGPAFPTALDGWQMAQEWTVTTRTFTERWDGPDGPGHGDYPATMNGCGDQRFLIRWRSLGAPVLSAWASGSSGEDEMMAGKAILMSKAEPADIYGWADVDGCRRVVFQFQDQPDGSNLGDVAVSVQQWTPTA